MKRLLFLLAISIIVGQVVAAPPLLTDYSNNVTIRYNITDAMGTQTDYQMKFNITNLTGVSGYINGENVIFTNGTTRPDFFDVNFTDESNNPQPFWMENNTCTANGCTFWGKVPTISVGNTSTGKWYFGNATQTASTMNGLNTFPYFTDWLGNAINTTQETRTGTGGTTTVGSGYVTVSSGTSTAEQLSSKLAFSYNYSIRSRENVSSEGLTWAQGFGNTGLSAANLLVIYNVNNQNWGIDGSFAARSQSLVNTTMNIVEISKFPQSSNFTYNNVLQATLAGTTSSQGNATIFSTSSRIPMQDWVFVRKAVPIEPIISPLSAGVVGINSSFTPNATTGYAYPWYVSFTDTSTGSPTTWNWTFGDSYTSTSQNPQHVFPVAGTYTVYLNVTNATGGFSNNSQTLTLTTDDDTYLHSWMHFNSSITAGEKGVAWTNTGCSLDTVVKKFGAGSLLCTNGNNFLSSASSPSWDLSPTANEAEFWVNVSVMGAAGKPLISRSTGTGTTNGWGIYSSDGTASGWKYWEGNSAANSSASFTLPLNTWTHVEISKNATYVDIRLNGVNAVSYAHTGVYNTVNPFVIGASGAGNEHTFNMDEFRFSSGVPRFTQDFSNSLMKVQYVGSLTGGIDTSPNSTFRYKTDPAFPATIANQTNGGTHNRTVQVQNMTEANYVLGSVIWDPLRQFGMAVRLNLTDYPDLVLVSSNIDNVNGEASFNVSRGGTNKITALFNNRTNLVDVQMLYWNYTSDTTGFQFFGDGMIINGTTVAPIHNFIQTNITFAQWDFYPNFSASTTTPITGQTVTFYDNTTGYPSAWNWSWGDGTWTNGTLTPSATHVYTSTGLKTVTMVGTLWQNYSITNTSTKTNYINVSASPSFTYQDIWMVGRYNQTFTVTDSQTGAPIPGVVISDANGQSFTAPTGTGYLTEPAGVFVAYFVATGYDARAISYIVDGDATHAVQLTKTIAPANQNTWWTPHTVQITLMDASYGFRLVDVAINATYNESAMPTEWITQLYGIQSQPGSEMVNKTLILGGTTGSDGTLTTTMLGSLKYDIYLTSSTYGLDRYHVQAYPSDSMLNIYVTTAGTTLPTDKNSTYSGLNGTRVYFTEPDIHNVTMCIDYIDSTGNTAYVNDTWMFQNNDTVFYTSNFTPGTTLNTSCYTLPNVRGTAVWWGYNSTRFLG